MSILILAGEMSGDRYGAELAKAIKKISPKSKIISAGGENLEKISDKFIANITTHSAIGLQSKIQGLFTYRLFYKLLNKALLNHAFEAAVIIDFQHHNFKIATYLQKYNIPILTFITPNFWLYKDTKKMTRLARYSQEIVCIFKKEKELYQKINKNTHYFGHPLISMSGIKPKKRAKTIQTIGLMPGSRKQEMKLYLNTLLSTVKKYHLQHPEIQFILLPSSDYFLNYIQTKLDKELKNLITVWQGNHNDFFNEIDCVLVASGSSTLDAILHSVPMVVLCALTPLTFFVAKYIFRLKIPYISLPNIIVQEYIIPELTQSKITPERIIEEINVWNNITIQEKRLNHYKVIQESMNKGQDVFESTANLLIKKVIPKLGK